MRNLKLTLSYDGTRYPGFSKPRSSGKNGNEKETQNTISSKLTETLERLTEEPIELFCGAKTEPGVHALEQTVSFRTVCPLSADKLFHSLNRYLPQDICIHSVTEMPERFHAALNAKSETYEYRIVNAPVMDVFSRKYALHLARPLDIAAMNEAAELFLGKHDFLPFSFGKAKKKKSSERDLPYLKITAMTNADPSHTNITAMTNAGPSHTNITAMTDTDPSHTNITAMTDISSACEIRICLTANHFLYQMPRLVVGTLLDVGLKVRRPDCVNAIFAGNEPASAPCAAHGLYLKRISYDD